MPERIILNQVLGLPLSLRKESPAQLQYLVDQMANCLPRWKGTYAKKWASNSGAIRLVRYPDPCNDGARSTDENNCCNEEDLQRFLVV